MTKKKKQLLFWTPRIMCIIFAMFLSIFSFDVFGENEGFWSTLFALLIHLIPVYLVLILLAVAWRWEWIGAIVFSALGLFYIVWALGRGQFPVVVYFTIPGPAFIIAGLFQLNWKYKEELKVRE